MPPPRPRGTGYNSSSNSARPSANAPMSERQQMALLMQMAANSPDISRAHSKKYEKKSDDAAEEAALNEKEMHDLAKEKSHPDETSGENKKENHTELPHGVDMQTVQNTSKRSFSDVDEDEGADDCDDVKKKKRKDTEAPTKDAKGVANMRVPGKVERNTKQMTTAKAPQAANKVNVLADKEHAEQANKGKLVEHICDEDDMKISEVYSGGLKVPPLKIVIPQQNCALDNDGSASRTGKVSAARNPALPYVVTSNSETSERDGTIPCGSPNENTQKPTTSNVVFTTAVPGDDKHIKYNTEEKNLQRVLRSSHRQGANGSAGVGCASGIERSSNNSSPQMQSSSPSPASSNHNENMEGKSHYAVGASPSQTTGQNQTYEHENIVNMPSPSTSSTSSSREINSSNVDLHPRKRKIRSKTDDTLKSNACNNVNVELPANVSDAHPHDFPFTNCFQMYLNIRRQIENKWKMIYPIKPRPPQGFSEYLINKRSYLLFTDKDIPNIHVPRTISNKMTGIFISQERERKNLLHRHTVEKEKLCLNVEQEIIRVHSKAARNISCQSTPYSLCTLLKDEEVYNIITPEQEEKDRNTRRFNGRLLLSWLQDVDDKWEKIKESMLLRHHNEAESLHAVQSMDWKIALKKNRLWDLQTHVNVDLDHVPIVQVNDDFDLLPA